MTHRHFLYYIFLVILVFPGFDAQSSEKNSSDIRPKKYNLHDLQIKVVEDPGYKAGPMRSIDLKGTGEIYVRTYVRDFEDAGKTLQEGKGMVPLSVVQRVLEKIYDKGFFYMDADQMSNPIITVYINNDNSVEEFESDADHYQCSGVLVQIDDWSKKVYGCEIGPEDFWDIVRTLSKLKEYVVLEDCK